MSVWWSRVWPTVTASQRSEIIDLRRVSIWISTLDVFALTAEGKCDHLLILGIQHELLENFHELAINVFGSIVEY
jgi:hypothetical protein